MKFILPKHLALLRNFGRVRFTGDDLFGLIRRCGIELVFSDEVKAKGRYYFCAETGKHVIVISTRIPKAQRIQVGWHEFGHYLQNYFNPTPTQADYCTPERRSRKERFADGFAFVCMTGVPMTGRMDFIRTLMTEDWN
jgi:hypothetical protein